MPEKQLKYKKERNKSVFNLNIFRKYRSQDVAAVR